MDVISKKNYTGTFAGGQGPIHGMTSSSEPETKGVITGEYKHVTSVDEGGHDSKPSGDDAHFDLHGASYAGPENWVPDNKGVVNPDDIQKSAGVKS
jgi:hypothetical protein